MRIAMTRLCKSFPTLRGADGVDPWDAGRLLKWLCTSGAVTSGSRHAAKFVLQVWNSAADWQAIARQPLEEDGLGLRDVELTPFNLVEAIAVWDDEHAGALRTWAYAPFFP